MEREARDPRAEGRGWHRRLLIQHQPRRYDRRRQRLSQRLDRLLHERTGPRVIPAVTLHKPLKEVLSRVAGGIDCLVSDAPIFQEAQVDVIAMDQVLSRLGALDPRMAEIVELRVFAGMPVRDVACVIGVSTRTVEHEWTLAKKWLRRELSAG